MVAKVGVLALQGDFEAHQRILEPLGVEAVQVRTREQLEAVDRLVIPGGESTTIGKLAVQYELIDPIRKRAAGGMPVFGTCAGLIMCARRVLDGDRDQALLELMDITVRRNAYGRQVDSFETDLDVAGVGSVHAVFIRAPVIEETGEGVEVLARHAGVPVLARQGSVMVAAFHPEIAGDPRLHEAFLGL